MTVHLDPVSLPDPHTAVVRRGPAPTRLGYARRLLHVGQGLLVVAAIVAGCAVLARNWGHLTQSLHQLSPIYWGSSLASALIAMACATKSWQVLFDALGPALGMRRAAPILLVGQLGKYLPGSMWAYVLQAELGRRVGVSRARVLTATVAATLIAIAAALVTGMLAVPALMSHAPDLSVLLWAYALLPFCAVVLHPRSLRAMVGLGYRLLRKPNPLPLLRGRTVLASFAWAALSYAFFGTHLWLLALSSPGTGISDLAQCAGTIAMAMIAGVFVVFLPSGLGVREVVMYAGLVPTLGPGSALAVAAVSRAVLTLGDLAIAASSAAWGWRVAHRGSDSRSVTLGVARRS